jgi:hypothetical protein
MIGRIAGFFSILAGALVAVGAFPAWVTLNAGGSSNRYNAFTIVGDHRDAMVSFVLAAVLLMAGFVLSMRPMLGARALGALAGIGAAIWAGLLFFSLAPQAHALIAPTGPSPSTSIELGLWITAGGGLLGLLTALTAAAARPRRVLAEPAAAAAMPATLPVPPSPAPTPRSEQRSTAPAPAGQSSMPPASARR